MSTDSKCKRSGDLLKDYDKAPFQNSGFCRAHAVEIYKTNHLRTKIPAAIKKYVIDDPTMVPYKEAVMMQAAIEHENIVRIIAYYLKNDLPVYVALEYCSHGNLERYLQQPQNHYGLSQMEYLVFLKHMTGAIRELERLKIYHRDIRPKNFLINIAQPDGISFKLCDFMNAKQYEDWNPKPLSLKSLTEHAHPRVLEAKLKLKQQRNATVDYTPEMELWSIGSTLYFAATQTMPFKSYDLQDMLDTIDQKNENDISNTRTTKYRVYQKTLPKNIRLSEPLKVLLEQLLVKLLQKNKFISFQEFFEHSNRITATVYLQVINALEHGAKYLAFENEIRVGDLQGRIHDQRDDPLQQLLIYDKTILKSADANRTVKINNDIPLLVINFDKADKNVIDFSPASKTKPVLHEPLSSETFHRLMLVLCEYAQKMTDHTFIHECLRQTVPVLKSYIHEMLIDQESSLDSLEADIQRLQTKIHSFASLYVNMSSPSTTETNKYRGTLQDLQKVDKDVKTLKEKLAENAEALNKPFDEITSDDESIKQFVKQLEVMIEFIEDLGRPFSGLPQYTIDNLGPTYLNRLQRTLDESCELHEVNFLGFIKAYFKNYHVWLSNLARIRNETLVDQFILQKSQKLLESCEQKIKEDIKEKNVNVKNVVRNSPIERNNRKTPDSQSTPKMDLEKFDLSRMNKSPLSFDISKYLNEKISSIKDAANSPFPKKQGSKSRTPVFKLREEESNKRRKGDIALENEEEDSTVTLNFRIKIKRDKNRKRGDKNKK